MTCAANQIRCQEDMEEMKIGIMVDSLKLGVWEGIRKASEMGVQGVQIYAVSGEMEPSCLDTQKRKELSKLIRQSNLEISALCGDLGGYGFTRKQDNPVKIEKSMQIMQLASDLGTRVVTTHIGVIPEDDTCDQYKVMQDACGQLGEYASRLGGHFAIETGPEKAATLKKFLDSLHTRGVCVNFDPANFVMVTDQDPVEAVFLLKDYIVHTHAKDGVMVKKTDPKIIYRFFAEGGIEDMRLEDYFLEKPLGLGNVDFKSYLNALNEIGYNGFLTIEREVGNNPEKDISEAIQFLKKYL